MSRTVKCPYCGKQASFDPSNPHRPFCSERCQLMDLGAWADEKYAVPGERVDPNTEVNENPGRDDEDEESSSDRRLH